MTGGVDVSRGGSRWVDEIAASAEPPRNDGGLGGLWPEVVESVAVTRLPRRRSLLAMTVVGLILSIRPIRG